MIIDLSKTVTLLSAVLASGGGGSVGSISENLFGNGSLSNTITTKYLTPGYDNLSSLTSETRRRVTFACTISNLFINSSGGGNGNDVVYTLLVNGTPTALTVTLSSAGVISGNDIVNVVAVNEGDEISIEAAIAVDLAAPVSKIVATIKLTGV